MTTTNKAVKDLLASYTPEVRKLALSTRSFVLDLIPNALEQVDPKAKIIAYGFGPKYAGTICVVMPVKSGVNLGFFRGTELPDPQKLLQGTGKLHRHVKLKDASDLKAPALRSLMNSAVAAKKQSLTK